MKTTSKHIEKGFRQNSERNPVFVGAVFESDIEHFADVLAWLETCPCEVVFSKRSTYYMKLVDVPPTSLVV